MGKKATLDDVLKNPDIKWDPDSTIDRWKEFYIPYYKDILDKMVDFEKLHFRRGEYYRVLAPVKLDGYQDILFGGDVIINDDTMQNKYEVWNLGLLPRLGNLQEAKKAMEKIRILQSL